MIVKSKKPPLPGPPISRTSLPVDPRAQCPKSTRGGKLALGKPEALRLAICGPLEASSTTVRVADVAEVGLGTDTSIEQEDEAGSEDPQLLVCV